MERSHRVTNDMGLEVKKNHIPSTPLPRQWDKYICNPKNKTTLDTFTRQDHHFHMETFWSLVLIYKIVNKLCVLRVGMHP